MKWRVPVLWPDNRCFIIGGGTSLKGVDLTLLKNERVIAVNNAYHLVPWADVCFFMDTGWYMQHREGLRNFSGLKVSLEGKRDPSVKQLIRGQRKGLSEVPTTLCHGHNSGYCAINLAYLFGATTIVLVGFDMQTDARGNHNWHTEHLRKMKTDIYKTDYIKHMEELSTLAEQSSVQILNTSLESALTCFPKISLTEYLRNGKRQE